MTAPLALLGGPPTVTHQNAFRWPPVGDEELAAIQALLSTGELSYYGREGEVERLEDSFRRYLAVEHALAVSSGTAALHSAYFGIGLEPGDEVIAPTYTFLATVMPIFVTNGVPLLADAESDTGNISVEDIAARITPRTRAIVVTHLWGHPCDMRGIMDLARRNRLKVIEDCSHAHGASCHGRKVGTFGDVAIFSLQAKKLVSAGQGGILVTSDREIYERANLLGHFKVRCQQEVKTEKYRPFAGTGFGLNYRMHPFAAAMANIQLGNLDHYIEARHANLDRLSERLEGLPGIMPPITRNYVGCHALYSYKPLYDPAQMEDLPADVYVEALRAEGVDVERSETRPLHMEPIFQAETVPMRTHGDPSFLANAGERRRYRVGDFPGSERYASQALVLPPYTQPVPALIEQIGDAFEKVAAHRDRLIDQWRSTLSPARITV